MVANEEEHKIQLKLIGREYPKFEERKSLNGADYPVPNVVGYYFCYLTPETTGRTDWGDSILISPASKLGDVIDVPLEAIVLYEIIKRGKQK